VDRALAGRRRDHLHRLFRLHPVPLLPHAISLVSGDYSDPKDAGEVSHFQALATALSGTVGLGNIAGVAVAVGIGGPGATFWMILAGLMGMASKFTECTLGVKYRNEYQDGTVSGGPMYYISKGFSGTRPASGGKVPGGRVLDLLHPRRARRRQHVPGQPGPCPDLRASSATIPAGSPASSSRRRLRRDRRRHQIHRPVTEKVVPFMGILYVGAALIILMANYDKIGWAFGQIFEGAFTGLGVAGGFVGALIQGFKRAAFSNEAGVGSAAIAHSAVRTKEPITEGFVSLLEPFIDTVVICTMTALVIVITGS
jgi:AGCS family alanine or glycine:cation symporter